MLEVYVIAYAPKIAQKFLVGSIMPTLHGMRRWKNKLESTLGPFPDALGTSWVLRNPSGEVVYIMRVHMDVLEVVISNLHNSFSRN
jgi:hypothetical protein